MTASLDLRLLDLLGIEYIAVLIAKNKREKEYKDLVYSYIADTINLVPQRKYRTMSLSDILSEKREEKSGRSGDDIVKSIFKKHGLRYEPS